MGVGRKVDFKFKNVFGYFFALITNANYPNTVQVLAPTDLRLNAAYRQIFFGWAYTLLMFVLPFAILIIVNTAVLLAIRRSNRLHSQTIVQGKFFGLKKHKFKELTHLKLRFSVPANAECNGHAADHSTEHQVVLMAKKATDSKERQTTAVLVALVIVFLCCNTLAFMSNIMVSFWNF